MSSFAPTVARQALRIASRRYPASAFARTSLRTAAAAAARRNYVSETKSNNATVNIDTTIQAEKKAFLNQTGERAEDATMPTTGMSADAMMSPTAGECRHPAHNDMRGVSDGY
jgi:cysteine desulfurase